MGGVHSTTAACESEVLITPPRWVYHCLSSCEWKERALLCVLSRGYRLFAQQRYHAQWMCITLAQENALYISSPLLAHISLASLFADLWAQRALWLPSAQDASRERTWRDILDETLREPADGDSATPASTADASGASGGDAATPALTAAASGAALARALGIAGDVEESGVRVMVRFKPPTAAPRSEVEKQQRAFALPLHQRLQLIRMRGGEAGKHALRTLKREGGWAVGASSSWKKQSQASASAGDNKENGEGGVALTQRAHVHSVDAGTSTVTMVAPIVGMRSFAFDHVAPHATSQRRAYDFGARRLVMDVVNGFNAAVVMYGQTGSGKTHTMFGPADSIRSEAVAAAAAAAATPTPDRARSSARGIVPRASEEMLAAVAARRARGFACAVTLSYVEIFGQEVSDLLRGGAPIGHNKVSAQRFVVEGEAAVPIRCDADVAKWLAVGDAQKRRAATAMNARSSRAHCIFILGVEMTHPTTNVKVASQLYLADLGGSEQVKKSKVHQGAHVAGKGFVIGEHMREAININVGLLALKKCITALNRGESFVPYFDSKLTMLLSPALGGDAKAAVIVCASMDDADAGETLQTLRFGEMCSKVANDAAVHASAVHQIVAEIDREMAELEATIRAKERWESRETRRSDVVGSTTVAEEVVRVGVVVGAEMERARLEELIRSRAALTGEDPELKLAESSFGGQFGGAASELGGHAVTRFAEDQEGLLIGGKKVAAWIS
jgi:kinesin family protein 5